MILLSRQSSFTDSEAAAAGPPLLFTQHSFSHSTDLHCEVLCDLVLSYEFYHLGVLRKTQPSNKPLKESMGQTSSHKA